VNIAVSLRHHLPLLRLVAAAAAAILFSGPTPLPAQMPEPTAGWNSPRAVELITLAQQRRMEQQVDTALLNYQADARGFVYFLLDHPESGRQSLVRTDQVAVEVYWQSPNLVRQHIVGWRERRDLPVSRLHYYLDRLTVVQDNFGDGIMIADGDNVNDVPHPSAPGAERVYDYLLVDSLTLRLPGAAEPVRVYELRVRPKQPDQSAVVGSIFLDARTGAVVRMNFTFTRAAYVDRRLDYINVTLENGLWRGRFWLPHEQRLEIRREVPEIDFPVGTVIRTRMRVGNYRFNEPLPGWIFAGRTITAAPREQREAFAFEQPIDAERRLEGIGRPMDVAELRREARQLVRQQALSGLPRARLRLGGASDLFRYNRAEGAVVGLGSVVSPAARWSLGVHGGWAFGAEHPLARAQLVRTRPLGSLALAGHVNQPRDVGVGPAASGAINTLASLFAGADYTDLFAASGASLGVRHEVGPRWLGALDLRFERQRSLERATRSGIFGPDDFRPVRPIDDGDFAGADLAVRRVAPAGTDWVWRGEASAGGGVLRAEDGERAFVQPRAALGVERNWSWRDARLEFDGSAGASLGDVPRQALFLLGGRGTVSGYQFRAFGGDRFALGRAAASAEMLHPWLRGRAFVEAGWAGVGEGNRATRDLWGASPTDGLVTGVGAGVGIFYDLLHVNVARGLQRGGRWELSVEAQRAFWDWL
jgi:hypothetical protein